MPPAPPACCIGASADPSAGRRCAAAMGSTFRLPVARATTRDALEPLARAAAAAWWPRRRAGTSILRRVDLRGRRRCLLGAEGAGLPDGAARARRRCASRIPMRPPVESLNVAVAAALVLYEAHGSAAARQRPMTRRALDDDLIAVAGEPSRRRPPAPDRTRRWPSACGRARSTRSSARRPARAGRPLREAIERDLLQSMILWGPPGTGKTTLARLIADVTDGRVRRLQRGRSPASRRSRT